MVFPLLIKKKNFLSFKWFVNFASLQVAYNDFVSAGSFAAAREKGLVSWHFLIFMVLDSAALIFDNFKCGEVYRISL